MERRARDTVNERHIIRARVLKCLHTVARQPICTACLSPCVGADEGAVWAALMTIGTRERVERAYTRCAECGRIRIAFKIIARDESTRARDRSKRSM